MTNKYGKTSYPEYNNWRGMRERCSNKNHDHYSRYGGRGIKVCDRWSNFYNFYEDMGQKPTPKHSLDRIDNNGNYEPSNCRWATQKEQLRNSSRVKLHTIDGVEDTITGHISRATDRSTSLVYKLMRSGLSLEQALKVPNDGIARKIERNRVAALKRYSNCLWCGVRCNFASTKYCSKSHYMLYRNKYEYETFNRG